MKPLPTQARLKELFLHDPETGEFVWKKRDRAAFATQSAYISFVSRCEMRVAGHIQEGYRKIVVDGRQYLAHRLIWMFIHGEDVKYPEYEIDHVNGNRSDNRIQNLRKVTKSQNQRNGSMRINNSSGVIGVNWCNPKKRWVARIWDGPRHKYLGQYANLADAAAARRKAEIELGYDDGHGKPMFIADLTAIIRGQVAS